MKFLCLGYYNHEKMNACQQSEIDAAMRECQPHLEKLYQSKQVIVDAGLDLNTTCIRRTEGKVMITDGPFAETKEMIGSVFIIEATDMGEAIQLATLHPAAQVEAGEQFGWRIEIRPIHYFKSREQER